MLKNLQNQIDGHQSSEDFLQEFIVKECSIILIVIKALGIDE